MRKPATQPQQDFRALPGWRPHQIATPTLRLLAPVERADDRDWIRLPEALGLLAAYHSTPKFAMDGLSKRVLLGQVPITCDTLIYERADGSVRTSEHHARPGPDARLAEQLLQATGDGRARLRVDVGNSDVEWSDVTGPYPVNAIAIGLVVDRAAVALMVARSAKRPAAPASDSSLPRPSSGKGLAILRSFHQRLKLGQTQTVKSAEFRAIQDAWPDPRAKPSEDTWARSAGPYWDRLTWLELKPQLDPQTTAILEDVTRI